MADLNSLIYLSSRIDLANRVMNSRPPNWNPAIVDNYENMKSWITHCIHTNLHESHNYIPDIYDFNPWFYIAQFTDNLLHFWDFSTNTLNYKDVCFYWLFYSRFKYPPYTHYKYIIVGSGHSNVSLHNLPANIRVIPINNAWTLCDISSIYRWHVASDYYLLGTIHPTIDEVLSIREIALSASVLNPTFICEKYENLQLSYYKHLHECPIDIFYKNKDNSYTGTMLINTLHILMKDIYKYKQLCEIYIIGSDFDYSNKLTHFYSHIEDNKASNDPLRYGKEWLIDELNHVNSIAKLHNYKIFNASNNPNSLLPFTFKSFT